jgi:dienelactone hydrolase
VIGAPAIADIYAGVVAVPYYLANSGGSPQSTAPLTGFWAADPTKPDLAASFLGQVPCGAFASGATLPDGQTATPSVSTTVCYPLPVKKSDETLPLLVAVPNANSGQSKPEGGWPVVIFQHGITGNRTQMLAIAPALAAAGFVTVAIDLPLHGLASSSPFYRNQLFTGTPAAGLMTGERTFDLDLVSNTTGAAGPDGVTDSSGTHFINLSSLITSRDNLRQASSDLLTLTKSLANLDLDNDGAPDIDGSQLRFVGHSLGGIVGGSFLGADTSVGAATLAMPGGGIAKLLDASKSFGPIISAGLAASGVAEGTDTYETFLRFAQTLVDSADPLNFAASAKANHPLHLIEVQGDTVVPNAANAGAASASNDLVTITGYLSGTDPLIATLGLDVVGPLTPPLTSVVLKTGAKLAVATVFTTGNHGSILDPSGSDINAATTQEMQRQTANFLKSNGTCLPTGGNCSAE